MSTLKEYQADIALRMRRGDTFASVEDEVIEPSPLSDREKSALWLFGWSFVTWQRQQREAVRHIELLARAEEGPELAPTGFAFAGSSSATQMPSSSGRGRTWDERPEGRDDVRLLS